MPKAQKPPQNASGAKVKQITDFFPRKSTSSQGAVPPSPTNGQKDAKQSLVKENTKPHSRSMRPRVHTANEISLNVTVNPGTQHPHSALSPKSIQITSPLQPPTKRLRSESTVSDKQTKRSKNILCESKFQEEKMEVEESSVVYVRSDTVVQNLPALQIPSPDSKKAENCCVVPSPSNQLEVGSLVPSSLSEEKELELIPPGKKDFEEVKEAVDRWRYQASLPLANRRTLIHVESHLRPDHPPEISGASLDTAGDSNDHTMCPRPNMGAIPSVAPPQAGESNDTQLQSAPEVWDTRRIIARLRAQAVAQPCTEQLLSPTSTISSLDSNDEDEFGTFDFNLRNDRKSESPVKAKSPIKPTRYNLRRLAMKTELEQPNPAPDFGRDNSPSPPAKRKPGKNPLDALLKEKKGTNKGAMRSADREAQLRDLANMNLNDDSDDADADFKSSKYIVPLISESDGNPFIDDDQKQQVMEILESDKVIQNEEEHLRQQGRVGVVLWGNSESGSMDSCDGLPPLNYRGPDSTLRSLAQTINNGDCGLVDLIMQSGVLEMASYAENGSNVVSYLIGLAVSRRADGLDVSASRVLTTLLGNATISKPVSLLALVLLALRSLGAQLSVLERLGWAIQNDPQSVVSFTERPAMVERLVSCIMDTAKFGCLHQQEVPDIVTILLLLGIETSSPHEVRLQVSQTIGEVCWSICKEDVVEVEVETAICNKVLQLVQPYSLRNKLYVLDLLSSGARRSSRVARSVAYAMLTDRPALPSSQYSELPPLSELVAVVEASSRNAPRPMGKFEIHEATDYVDMACWTSILAIAVSDIPQYVKQEELGGRMSSPMKSPSKEKDHSLVLTLHDRLYKIHGRIQDTRAAHLDRSRTKAILFQTTFRILYQYQAVSQYRKKNGHGIQSYFRKK